MTHKTDFREFARHDRFRAFEILLWWEGQCNASNLGLLFNVRRENVSKDVQAYRSDYGRGVCYDSGMKTYRPTDQFKPVFTEGHVSEYIDFIRRFRWNDACSSDAFLETGPRPYIEPCPRLFRSVLSAIRTQSPMHIRYRSWNHPAGRDRVIHPHAIAYSGLRWHCRAYDEITGSFRDFHLGRFDNYQVGTNGSAFSGEMDTDWHTYVDVELVPNPELSEGEQQLVRADYGLQKEALSLNCRQAMVLYLLKSYHVDPELNLAEQTSPRSRPLVLRDPAANPSIG